MIDVIYTSQVKPGMWKQAMSCALEQAKNLRDNYATALNVEVLTSIDGPQALIWVARHESLAKWEETLEQFAGDEKGQEIYHKWRDAEISHEWHFYRVQ